MQEAARDQPELIEVTADPIVSSDVKGSRRSVLFDLGGTVKAGRRTIKMLIWHESLGHANRILDLIRLYAELDSRNSGGTH
jgi:glyceraldehyde 3-phosphate dehydrogenase